MYRFKLDNLSKVFRRGSLLSLERISAVDRATLSIEDSVPWIFSIVGESGSGKTTIAKMLLGIHDLTEGEVELFDEPLRDLLRNKEKFHKNVQPIFQNPFTSFSSRRPVEDYLFDTAKNLLNTTKRSEIQARIEQVLEDVGLRFDSIRGKYSNQFSGGELQRLSIARALITEPKLIVADEPIAMVDASLKMNIVNIFKYLKETYNICFIYITHDLSTAYYISDYLMTMYQGQVVEYGDAQLILDHPQHPYTRLLLESIPRIGQIWDEEEELPDYDDASYTMDACRYKSRCPWARALCGEERPELKQTNYLGREHHESAKGHQVACFAIEHGWVTEDD